MKIKPDRKYLIIAGLLPFAGDILMTLVGQPASYWTEGAQCTNEANHIALALLNIHPAIFIFGAITYSAVFSGLIYALPRVFAWWLSIGLLLAHIGGMKSWIPLFSSWEYYSFLETGLNVIAALMATLCYLKAGSISNQSLELTRDNA